MKRLPAFLAASVLAFVACKEKPAPEPAPTPATASGTPVDAGPKPSLAAPDTFKAALGRIYEGYLGIQGALAQDDLGKAMEVFSAMHGMLHMVPKDALDSAGLAAWDSSDARMMAVLHPMAASKDIEEFRSHFAGFSAAMEEAIRTFGMDGHHAVYKMHCPMAQAGKGADWLQGDTVVANPYMGKAMPACGERLPWPATGTP